MSESHIDRIQELERQLAAEKAKNEKKIHIVVSTKGCVQVNGLRRFPFSFYKSELKTILSMKYDLEEFMQTHDNELK